MSSRPDFNVPSIGRVKTRARLDEDGMPWPHFNVGLRVRHNIIGVLLWCLASITIIDVDGGSRRRWRLITVVVVVGTSFFE